jgi:hypothetical protein
MVNIQWSPIIRMHRGPILTVRSFKPVFRDYANANLVDGRVSIARDVGEPGEVFQDRCTELRRKDW